MAISTYNGNTFFTDQGSSSGDSTTFIVSKDIQIHGLIFISSSSGDSVEICDIKLQNAAYAADGQKFFLYSPGAKTPVILDFYDTPVRCPNGIWISSISAGAKLTLILDKKG